MSASQEMEHKTGAESVRRARLFALVALGLAAVVLVFGVAWPLYESRTGTWVKTPCEILESRVEEATGTEPWGNGTREFPIYLPRITYRYAVGGQVYESARLSLRPGERTRDPQHAAALVAEFPAGSRRQCLVDPDAPDSAILQPPGYRLVWASALGALILGLFGAMVFVIAPRT